MDSQVKRQGRTVLRHRGRGIKHEAACAGERLDEKASVDQHGTERSQRTGEMGAVIRVAMEQGAMAHNVPLSGSGIAAALVSVPRSTRLPLSFFTNLAYSYLA